ncbi:MAG: hydroxymethylglutaryl-CoA lyase [Proteobacteria bacterium]|nr:hydroxymethylglutaryl-CoA lyase [Pseudomonadota bacterium]
MDVTSKVKLREVSPRDGFQSLRDFIPTEKKLEIIDALINSGIKELEATSFVSPKAIPQLRDASDLMSKMPKLPSVIYAALVPNLRGAENAIQSGVDQLVVVISATEAHNQANVRRSIKESLSDLDAIFALSRQKKIPVIGAIGVALGCPYQGDVPDQNYAMLIEEYISRGSKRIILADTAGMSTPRRVEKAVQKVLHSYPDIEFIFHFHNNRGTAMANLVAAINAGATTFDTALGGIGGCPNLPQAAGNLPTEDVVYLLDDMGIDTGIDLISLVRAARFLEEMLGYTLPGQVMKSGPRFKADRNSCLFH